MVSGERLLKAGRSTVFFTILGGRSTARGSQRVAGVTSGWVIGRLILVRPRSTLLLVIEHCRVWSKVLTATLQEAIGETAVVTVKGCHYRS